MQTPDKILVIRNDKIGDFMLAWPALSLLKKQFPNTEITAMVPSYTAELANHCEWIDKVLIDDQGSSIRNLLKLAKKIRIEEFDTSISFFSQTRTSFALWLARVNKRVGPATKIAQIFLNTRLKQKRSRSLKPEYEYNIDLVRFYIESLGLRVVEPNNPPYLHFAAEEITSIKDTFYRSHDIDNTRKLVFIHPGTGGSAINLAPGQYAKLANTLAEKHNIHVIITAGPGEQKIAEELNNRIKSCPHHIYNSTDGLIAFSKHISFCDLFISGSTGPLHLAGALNVKTAAFYPAKRSATELRWQTTNAKSKRLAFSPSENIDEDDVLRINITYAAQKISDLLLR